MQQRTISWLCCDPRWKVDFIQQWQSATTISVVGPRESSKALPKPKLALKKRYVIVWWSAACLIHCSFLNSSEAITSEKYAQQIDEMHWKLQPQQLAMINRKGPILLHKAWPHVAEPTLQRLNELGYEVLPHLPHSPDLVTTDYRFFKHLDNFLQGKCSYNQQETENAFQEFI